MFNLFFLIFCSSRFTDSKKYEDDFVKCFQLEERRTGEICNACVLLVKRWKKLPVGSTRNWKHVSIFCSKRYLSKILLKTPVSIVIFANFRFQVLCWYRYSCMCIGIYLQSVKNIVNFGVFINEKSKNLGLKKNLLRNDMHISEAYTFGVVLVFKP